MDNLKIQEPAVLGEEYRNDRTSPAADNLRLRGSSLYTHICSAREMRSRGPRCAMEVRVVWNNHCRLLFSMRPNMLLVSTLRKITQAHF